MSESVSGAGTARPDAAPTLRELGDQILSHIRDGDDISWSDVNVLADYVAGLQLVLAERDAECERLRARLYLLDGVICEHHEASLVTWDGACPVCEKAGGIYFFDQNARLYRGPASAAVAPAAREGEAHD